MRWMQQVKIRLREAPRVLMRWAGRSADHELRASEERFALAVLGAKDGIWDRDLATDLVYLSARAQEISLGRASDGFDLRHEAEWRKWHQIHPEDASRREAAMREHLKGRTPQWEGEWRVRHQDGSYHWVHARGICTRDASGRAVRFAGSVTDIDARQAAAEALRISGGGYADAMEGSDAGHWDWNLVTDEMFVSKRAGEMLALPDGPLPVRRDEIMALVPQHPEDRALMPEKIQFGIESGSHEREYRVIPRAGEVRWLRSRGKVFRDAQGVPVRLTGSLLDITDRKLAADALRLSDERYALGMQASQEGHYDWNVQTDEIFVSPKTYELVGLPGDVKHANRTALIRDIPYHPEDRARLFTELAAVLASPALRHEFEYRIVVNRGKG